MNRRFASARAAAVGLLLLPAIATSHQVARPPAPPAPSAAVALPTDAAGWRLLLAKGQATVDIFCMAAGRCSPSAEKRALFELFFRGSFAQSEGGLDSALAYAEQGAAYLTEPDYACRRPLTARVLETLWDLPAQAVHCQEALPFLLIGEQGKRSLRHIDPARVAGVHLLFAGASGRSFSRFGHVGLRLVVCAPAQTAVDARCDADLTEHVALGFRAAVDELELSTWKGLTGGYRVRLYADPFLSAYDEYSRQEFRSLTSLPLQLDPAQRELLVRALAEVHWTYQHDYRFFSQNCASELSWLLRVISAVTGASPPWLGDAHVRPDRLFASARRSPAFSSAVLADLKQAEREGFYFPSSAAYYQMALDHLVQTLDARGIAAPAVRFDALRALDAATRRQQFYAPALDGASAHVKGAHATQRSAHAALVLEAWMEARLRRELLASLGRYYLDVTEEMLAVRALFTEDEAYALRRCRDGLRSTTALGAAPGVPNDPELPETGCELQAPVLRSALEKLHVVAPLTAHQNEQLAELRATVDTVNWLLPHSGLAPAPSPTPDVAP